MGSQHNLIKLSLPGPVRSVLWILWNCEILELIVQFIWLSLETSQSFGKCCHKSLEHIIIRLLLYFAIEPFIGTLSRCSDSFGLIRFNSVQSVGNIPTTSSGSHRVSSYQCLDLGHLHSCFEVSFELQSLKIAIGCQDPSVSQSWVQNPTAFTSYSARRWTSSSTQYRQDLPSAVRLKILFAIVLDAHLGSHKQRQQVHRVAGFCLSLYDQ